MEDEHERGFPSGAPTLPPLRAGEPVRARLRALNCLRARLQARAGGAKAGPAAAARARCFPNTPSV